MEMFRGRGKERMDGTAGNKGGRIRSARASGRSGTSEESRLYEAVSVGEGIVFPSHLLERLHSLSDVHSTTVTLRPARHAREGMALRAILFRAPQRSLIAG